MARTVYFIVACCMIALAALLVMGARHPDPRALPVVKIDVTGGHGSGVHIGDGYVVTAAHVVENTKSVTVVSSTGAHSGAEVLWINKTYDIALLRVADVSGFQAAALACRVPQEGETLLAAGNPLSADFINLRGYVAGGEREMGSWKRVVPVDMGVIPGMSGGPVYDEDGSVVGISVGVMLMRLGFGASLTRIGLIVPAAAVCDLMGR